MTDYNNSTAELDEAQKDPKTTSEEYGDKLKNFITNTLTSGIKLIIYCIIGLLIIYLCKIAQSNVLPTDINCYPYTDEKGHDPEKINTFIFTNLFFSKPRKAMILEFPNINNSFINSTLKYFNEYKDNPKSTFLGNFFVNIFQSLFVKNFNYYNTMFSFINQIPEFLLVIFGYYLGILVFVLGTLMNVIFLCYYWFSNLGWFLKKNVNVKVNEETGEIIPLGKPKWVDLRWQAKLDKNNEPIEGTSEWSSFLIGIILIIVFIWILIFSFFLQFFSIFGAVFSIYCLVACFMYESKLAGKSINFTDLFVYLFKYNKLIIMTMFSYSVISSAYYSLGPTSAGFAVLTLFCIYYFKIIEMFVPVKSDSDERVEVEINSKQAYKVPCDPPPEENKETNNVSKTKSTSSKIASTGTTKSTTDSGSTKSTTDSAAKGTTSDSGAAKSTTDSGAAKSTTDSAAKGTTSDSAAKGSTKSTTDSGATKSATDSGATKSTTDSAAKGSISDSGAAKSTTNSGTKGSTTDSGTKGSTTDSGTKGSTTDSGAKGTTSDVVTPITSNAVSLLNDGKNKSTALLNDVQNSATSALNKATTDASKLANSATSSLNNTLNQLPKTGGKNKKILEISSDNLVRELKKFNKKYAQFLL